MSEPKLKDFGGWVSDHIKAANVTPSDLSRETGIPYPSLDRMLKSGIKGRPVRPERDSIQKIAEALVQLQVISNVGEAWAAAGFIVEGYEVRPVKETELNTTPPENFEDWPIELRQALAHSKTLSRETQEYVYKLWLEDVVSHVDREARRQAALQKLTERQERIDQEKLNKASEE